MKVTIYYYPDDEEQLFGEVDGYRVSASDAIRAMADADEVTFCSDEVYVHGNEAIRLAKEKHILTSLK